MKKIERQGRGDDLQDVRDLDEWHNRKIVM